MEPIERIDAADRSGFPVAFAAGAIVVLIIAAGILLLSRSTRLDPGPRPAEKLAFGPTEQAYAAHIHFSGIQMARSSNLLNQEFTYVAGTLSNDGDHSIRALEATFEFHDRFKQTVLRETQRLLNTAGQPVAAGQHADFQITLEHVPSTWDMQYPSIRVTGLTLQ